MKLTDVYLAVHFILHSALAGEDGTSLVPLVLAGNTPPPHPESSTIGSGNFSQVPRAVLLGGAFDERLIHSLHQAALADPNARRVPWARMDKSRPGPLPTDPEYPKLVVQRSKAALIQLEKDGKLDGTYSELEYF